MELETGLEEVDKKAALYPGTGTLIRRLHSLKTLEELGIGQS